VRPEQAIYWRNFVTRRLRLSSSNSYRKCPMYTTVRAVRVMVDDWRVEMFIQGHSHTNCKTSGLMLVL